MNKLSALDPLFLRAVTPLLNEFAAKGIKFEITSTFRTQEEQDKLTNDGYPTASDSNHLTGRAVDLWILDKSQRTKAAYIAGQKGFRAVRYGVYNGRDLTPLLHIDLGKNRKTRNGTAEDFGQPWMPFLILGGLIFGLTLFKRSAGLCEYRD